MIRGYALEATADTPTAAARGTTTGRGDVARPFTGWLVRAEAAAAEVSPMAEIAIAARSAPRAVRSDAYEPMPPALYVYRQTTPHGDHTGIVCDITPESFLDGTFRGHESVQPQRVDALTRYLATTPQRIEPVSTLHRAGPVVQAMLALAPELPADRDIAGPDGSRHTVWRVPPGPQTERLCRELSAATHYIADGHHRVAASLNVWARSGRDPRCGVLCVAYPLDGLRLASFHRRVAGPVDSALMRDLLEASFHVRPVAGWHGAPATAIAVYLDRRWHIASYTGRRPSGSPGLDVSLLHDHVLDKLPVGTKIEHTRNSIEDLVTACDADGGILFALPAPHLETLTAIADARQVVPAKSSFFSPKPGSGIFLRAPASRPCQRSRAERSRAHPEA